MPQFMNGRLPSLRMDDLEAIITDKSAQLANRRVFNFIVAIFVFLILTSLSLLVAVLTLTSRRPPCVSDVSHDVGQAGSGVCMTAGCLQAAAGVLDSADFSVNPCSDFHQFACGGWIRRHSVPPDQAYISVFDHLFADSEEKLRETLESPVRRTEEKSSERKMKEFFSLCIHDYGRMKESGRTMVEEIEESLGGGFLLDPHGWRQGWSLRHALVKAHTEYGVPALFNYYVSPDPKDRSKNIIGIQLPPEEFDIYNLQHGEKTESVNVFRQYVRTLGKLLLRDSGRIVSQDDETYVLDTFEEDVYVQELRLAKLRSLVDESIKWEGKVMKLRDLASNFTQVDWVSIITTIFKDAAVTADASVAITSLPYFQGLELLLKNESSTMERMMNNYIVWVVVHTFADHLSWEYRQLKYDLLEKISGRTEFPSTWHACLSLMKAKMGFALAVELAKLHMADTGRKEVEVMVALLKKATHQAIRNALWMDEETRRLAILKINSMETEIGFPPVLSDEEEIDALYSKLHVNKSEGFFRNLLYASRFKSVLASIEYKTGYKYNLWEYAFFYNPLGVRPLYLWFYNTLIVPPGVFNHPLYSQRAPQAVNYGALGSYLGARMIRAVDEVGRLVVNGTFYNWWSTYSLANYLLTTRCLVQYFHGQTSGPYLIDGRNQTVAIDGHYQVIRVVAESAGLRLAYSAYKTWVKTHRAEPQLPGLNMTSDQIFFLAAAQARCTLRRDQSSFQLTTSGALPVDRMLNTMMSHSKAFSKAYHCQPGAAMRPRQQCTVFSPDNS